jgi:hypothetical protein
MQKVTSFKCAKQKSFTRIFPPAKAPQASFATQLTLPMAGKAIKSERENGSILWLLWLNV